MKLLSIKLLISTTFLCFFQLSSVYALTADDVECQGCIDTIDILPKAITSGRIAPNAVTSTRIAPNAITSGRIQDGQVKTQDIADKSISANKLEQTLLDTINSIGQGNELPSGVNEGDLLYWDGTSWNVTPAPPIDSTTIAPVLTLCDGVPKWLTSPCVAVGGYKLGDIGPSGGIVFYTTDLGLHGLEAGTENITNAAAWGCSGAAISGADGIAVGTGSQNTLDIIASCAEVDTAAKLAANYISDTGIGGWYLPSKDELDLLFKQKALFTNQLDNNYFWSSSENNDNTAWYQYIFNGGKSFYNKEFSLRVRAVKSF